MSIVIITSHFPQMLLCKRFNLNLITTSILFYKILVYLFTKDQLHILNNFVHTKFRINTENINELF